MFKALLPLIFLGAASIVTADKFGNYYNYWLYNGTNFDLTRFGSSNPKTIETFSNHNSTITISPENSTLVLIDMQNYFLDPTLSPGAHAGRAIVPAMLDTINAFRAAGIKISWVQWGIDDYHFQTMSPSFLYGFSDGKHANTSFGSEMGFINETIDAGRLLWRGSWNAQQWGPLYESYVNGTAAGSDVYFNKDRLSGLWGIMTPFEAWLNDNQITTLFFGGVNTDQCVFGTMIDAVFKGYDTIMVEDICATTSPLYATQMVVYNIGGDGWTTNSTQVIAGLSA